MINVPTIFNIDLPIANVENSKFIDVNPVTKINMVCRRQDGFIKVAFRAGETDTNFITVYGNRFYNEQGISGAGMTIYGKSSVDNNALEIVVWQ